VQRVLDGLFEDGHGRQKKRTRRRRQRLGRDVSAANEETALFRDSKRRGDLLDGHGQCHTDDDASHTGMTPMMVALKKTIDRNVFVEVRPVNADTRPQ